MYTHTHNKHLEPYSKDSEIDQPLKVLTIMFSSDGIFNFPWVLILQVFFSVSRLKSHFISNIFKIIIVKILPNLHSFALYKFCVNAISFEFSCFNSF